MKKFLVILLFAIATLQCLAQKSEVGFLAGICTYKGDLNPVMLDYRFFKPGASMFYRYNVSRHWSFRSNLSFGYIYGDDALSNDGYNKNRNLSFVSPVLEASQLVEFNFVPYEIGNKKYPFTPYVFAGIGIFHFNPQGKYVDPVTGTETLVPLQPLGTEGQGTTQFPDRKEYSLIQLSIPFGIGIKLNVGSFGIGFEVGARKTFTDYLDDVSTTFVDKTVIRSQSGDIAAAMSDKSISNDTRPGAMRGNSNDNDWYMFSGFTVYFNLDRPSDGCDSFHKLTSRFFQPQK